MICRVFSTPWMHLATMAWMSIGSASPILLCGVLHLFFCDEFLVQGVSFTVAQGFFATASLMMHTCSILLGASLSVSDAGPPIVA